MAQLHFVQVQEASIGISVHIRLHIYKSTSNNTDIWFNLFEILPMPSINLHSFKYSKPVWHQPSINVIEEGPADSWHFMIGVHC